MGVACPPEDEDHSSRDEIRKRALLALEGRSVVAGFAKVEIPEWNTPTAETKTFDWELRECCIIPFLNDVGLIGLAFQPFSYFC